MSGKGRRGVKCSEVWKTQGREWEEEGCGAKIGASYELHTHVGADIGQERGKEKEEK